MKLGLFLFVILIILMNDGCSMVVHPWLEQINRLEILSKQCENSKKIKLENSDLDHILVDHNHKFLYCYVPKVACTNWKRLLMVLTGRSNTTNVITIPATLAHDESSHLKLSDITFTNQLQEILNTYTLFMMVRHPFERILSAYRNKFEGSHPSAKYFQSSFGRQIIKQYRRNPTENDLRTGANVTFKEFVKYLINEGVEGQNANEHWRSIHSLCRPCDLNYTFIGRYESFSQDTQSVLGMIGAPKLDFPQTRSGHTEQRLRTYFRQLDIEEIQLLFRLYEKDFKLFGYSTQNVLGYDIG